MKDSQLYLNTIASKVVVRPLLPTNNRQVIDVAVSPDKGEIVFLASSRSAEPELWTTSLNGTPGPIKLKGYQQIQAKSLSIIGWFA